MNRSVRCFAQNRLSEAWGSSRARENNQRNGGYNRGDSADETPRVKWVGKGFLS